MRDALKTLRALTFVCSELNFQAWWTTQRLTIKESIAKYQVVTPVAAKQTPIGKVSKA